ncbi:ABC transporter ATP-binding protein [Pseudorhodoplanes sp.]|uniref:ABC transporter ATP-binding protein n=1 Tax=Pseudorhodoplanes sp. TaxID=1934341 RepID=UPI002D11E665|nr:ABC transporter ATP-binding protein [Pseudorhodoplanes sp.]HWV54777.1 ABC transporter ATP-binding protein [Pseudorhodoplanes sp.]
MTALLAAKDISVRLGGRTVVEDARVTLSAGELVALVGPNGAGKTTFLKALAGLLPAFGTIELEGQPMSALKPHERARRLAYLPQGHSFSWPLPAGEIVALGRYPHADPFSPVSDRDRAAVDHALDITGTRQFADRIVTTLSGGERARVALARVLATEAKIVLADEPIMSLDPRHQFVVMDVLRHAAQAGGAVLAVIHDLALAARYADRILMLEKGRIVADEKPEIALSPEKIATIFGVEADMICLGDAQVPLVRKPL